MPQNRELAVCLLGLLALFGGVFAFGYLWYSRTYKPAVAGGRMLSDLASSIRKRSTEWTQTSDVSTRGIWTRLAPIYTNDKVEIIVHGTWNGRPAAIQFKLDVGMPETGFWGRFNSVGDAGIYHPPMTTVRLTSREHLAAKAGIDRFSSSQLLANRAFAALGASPQLKPVAEGLFAYGEDAEIARLFNPSVLALVHSFPRDLFGPSFEGPVIEGREVRMSWEGHETDPKVIEAAFRLLKTISDAGAAGR